MQVPLQLTRLNISIPSARLGLSAMHTSSRIGSIVAAVSGPVLHARFCRGFSIK